VPFPPSPIYQATLLWSPLVVKIKQKAWSWFFKKKAVALTKPPSLSNAISRTTQWFGWVHNKNQPAFAKPGQNLTRPHYSLFSSILGLPPQLALRATRYFNRSVPPRCTTWYNCSRRCIDSLALIFASPTFQGGRAHRSLPFPLYISCDDPFTIRRTIRHWTGAVVLRLWISHDVGRFHQTHVSIPTLRLASRVVQAQNSLRSYIRWISCSRCIVGVASSNLVDHLRRYWPIVKTLPTLLDFLV